MEISQGNTMENSGKQNPKIGVQVPSRAEEEIRLTKKAVESLAIHFRMVPQFRNA
jgi:hypothetical protein